jgi:hypothetical protein
MEEKMVATWKGGEVLFLTWLDDLREENNRPDFKYLAEGTILKPENLYVSPKGISSMLHLQG